MQKQCGWIFSFCKWWFLSCCGLFDMAINHSSLLRTFFFQPLPKIHTSYQYLEDLEWFEDIFKIFARAIFEAIEVKGPSRLNFEAATSKFCNHIRKFGCQPGKSKADLCMTIGCKVLIYLTFMSFFLHLLTRVSLWGTIKKTNKSELWNRLSYRGLPYFFEVVSQSEMIAKFRGRSLKIQDPSSFDLNGFKNSPTLHFKNSLKSMYLLERLMGGMNRR
jgi:hypothetical protein